MGIFKGIRTKNGAFVTYDDSPLDLRLDLKSHSPMGFEWGYNGSGPKQLALAILTKLTSDEDALELYKEFSKDFIEPINTKDWDLDEFLVREWLKYNDVICNIPPLPPRFNNIDNMMYLDNKPLGAMEGFGKKSNTKINVQSTLVFCNLSEIDFLLIKELPEDIIFIFADLHDAKNESEITENFTLASISNLGNTLAINYWYNLNLIDYLNLDNKNPLTLVNDFIEKLHLNNFRITYQNIDDGIQFLKFSYYAKDTNIDLKTTIQDITDVVLKLYKDTLNVFEIKNTFEAIFTLPPKYKSVLKPYMQYFEEFLNDLCIQADVDIRQNGLDTILSVEPKNKDEALEKIADALKIYLSAPILANQVGLDEKLNMQLALNKLHAECMHLDAQLTLKSIILNEQNKQIEHQKEIIDETKRILIEAGVSESIINSKNTMLLNSLKSIKINNKGHL